MPEERIRFAFRHAIIWYDNTRRERGHMSIYLLPLFCRFIERHEKKMSSFAAPRLCTPAVTLCRQRMSRLFFAASHFTSL